MSSIPPRSFREYLAGSRAHLLLIALAIFGMYLPVVIVPYAFSDDYPILALADGFGPSPWFGDSILDHSSANGRPLAGLMIDSAFSAAGTIDNLRFVRLTGLVGVVGLAFLLHHALVRSGIRSGPAVLVAVLVPSLPAFQVIGSWSILFHSSYAAILAGGASMLAVATVQSREIGRFIEACAVMLAGLLIYHPAAMFFWVFLAIALIGAVEDRSRARRLIRTHVAVAAVALPVALLVLKLGLRRVGEGAPEAARNSLAADPIAKARWFVKEPLFRSVNLFDLTPSPWVAGLVASVAAVGIVVWLGRRADRPLLYVGTAVALIPASFIPSLAAAENSSTYRVVISLSSLIAVYFAVGILGLWSIATDLLRPRLERARWLTSPSFGMAVAGTLVAVCAVVATRNVTNLFVEPQITELRIIRSQVAAFPAIAPRVAVVHLSRWQGMTDLVIGDEFGRPSSSKAWTLDSSIFLVLREQGRLTHSGPRPIVDVVPWFDPRFPPDEPRVDVRELELLR